MKILIKQDFDTMSEWAKMLLLSTMSQDKRVNLSITAGKRLKVTMLRNQQKVL